MPVLADGEAEYKYREGVMKAIRGQMSAISAITRGGIKQENLAIHARSLSDLAEIVPGVFPEGSGVGKSEVLPAVWDDPDAFSKATKSFIEAANEFAQAVDDEQGITEAQRKLSRACKNCHDNFREE